MLIKFKKPKLSLQPYHFMKYLSMKLIHVVFVLYLACTSFYSFAEKENIVENEALLKKYLQQSTFDIDSSAQAIILYEKGYSTLGDDVLEFHVERTIKFLGDAAINDLGVINIPYRDRTFITKITGSTYNLVDGKVVEQAIGNSDVLREKINENISVSKFNLPGIKKGSIIHYSYSVYRHGTILIPAWNFQNDYPTLYSEYEILIPSSITYNSIERFNDPMVQVKRRKELAGCNSCSFSEMAGGAQVSNHVWIRRDIPAFKVEPFMSSADNFRERVKVNIAYITSNGYKTQVYTNWEDFTKKYFYTDNDFAGQVFSGNNFLKDKTEELTHDKANDIEKAKAIFSFVRDNFTSVPGDGGKPQWDIKDIFNRKTGSAEGINLLLTAMLRKANMDSEPVLLSTRENERLNSLYIDPGNIDYVVSRVIIDKKTYLLDASNKYFPFNTLPYECYNGYCRTIGKNGGAAMVLDPDSIKNKTTILASLEATADPSKLLLKMDKQYGVFTAMDLRRVWAGDTTEVKQSIQRLLEAGNSAYALSGFSVKNLTDPDRPLSLHYEVLIDFDNRNGTIYMDPFFAKLFEKNPFPQTKRMYTVEMDYLEDINYILNFKIPKGYVLDDYPKSVIHQYGNDKLMTMKNVMTYDADTKLFVLNSRFTSKTTLISAADYDTLRKFYEAIMEEQTKKMIIKKQ
jgi:hypothetical protein